MRERSDPHQFEAESRPALAEQEAAELRSLALRPRLGSVKDLVLDLQEAQN